MTRRLAIARLAGLLALAPIAAHARQSRDDRPRRGAAFVNGKRHEGHAVRVAPPESMHHKNLAGTDGSGLCVWASIEHAARFQGIDGLVGILDRMTRHPGGGWPERVDRVFAEILGPDHGLEYVHLYGPDMFPVLEQAIADGYLPCVSLGYSERYGEAIDHWVNPVLLNRRWAVVLDNNFPGLGSLEWIPRDEFERRALWSTRGRGEGWAMIIFSGQPQPPEPEPGA